MVIDLERCIGCNACTIACKQEKGTPQGVNFARVQSSEVGSYPATKRAFLPQFCNHCSDAACESACPTGATFTTEDGIVTIDTDDCIGCRACAVSCPYNHRHFIEDGALSQGTQGDELTKLEEKKYESFQERTVAKCDFCADRVDNGRDPACVDTCPTDARIFGDLEDMGSEVNQVLEEKETEPLLPEAGTSPNVYYVEDEAPISTFVKEKREETKAAQN